MKTYTVRCVQTVDVFIEAESPWEAQKIARARGLEAIIEEEETRFTITGAWLPKKTP